MFLQFRPASTFSCAKSCWFEAVRIALGHQESPGERHTLIIFSSADIIRPVRDRILEAIDDYGRGAEAVSIEADHVSGKQQSLELFGKAHWGFLIRRRHGVCLLHGQSGALMHNLF